jgi:hypothetical protein
MVFSNLYILFVEFPLTFAPQNLGAYNLHSENKNKKLKK